MLSKLAGELSPAEDPGRMGEAWFQARSEELAAADYANNASWPGCVCAVPA